MAHVMAMNLLGAEYAFSLKTSDVRMPSFWCSGPGIPQKGPQPSTPKP